MSLLPKELIREIVKKGNFNSAADIQEALKDLMKEFIQESFEAELDNQLGYEKYGKNGVYNFWCWYLNVLTPFCFL